MKRNIYFFATLILLFSCNNSGRNSNKNLGEFDLIETAVKEEVSKEPALKESLIEINHEFYISAIKSAKDTISDFDKYKTRDFTRQKDGQTDFKYYLLKEVHFSNSFRSYLIAEYYESEQSCWLANYDRNNNIISVCEVYYDNAEGAWMTTSMISPSDKMIQINNYDAYASPENTSEILRIGENGKFIQ